MRRTASLLLLLIVAARLPAQTQLTVRQLEGFLLSRDVQRESDAAVARQLASFQLSEQFTPARLAILAAKLRRGPQTAEQIELLAAASIFEPPPPAELVPESPPDAREQNRILEAARDYANSTARRLPDFLALRSTRSYDNAPPFAAGKHKPEFLMHFVGARRRQVTVRAGQEVSAAEPAAETSSSDHAEGMTTWGEFGPLLTTVLDDAQAGSVAWSRWQTGPNGVRLAVFHYSVPRSASHDLVDLCCDSTFRDTPAYHGDLYIDPAFGTILRITLDADLPPGAPVLVSRLSVQYAPVQIGGNTYVCPVRGTAVSVVHNQQMELLKGGGPERFVNLVDFTDYHKFVSTSRIVPSN